MEYGQVGREKIMETIYQKKQRQMKSDKKQMGKEESFKFEERNQDHQSQYSEHNDEIIRDQKEFSEKKREETLYDQEAQAEQQEFTFHDGTQDGVDQMRISTIPNDKKIETFEWENMQTKIDDMKLKQHFKRNLQQEQAQTNEKPRNLESEDTCPEPELWIKWIQSGDTNTRIYVNDHEIRATDQGQVLVGTYYEDYTNNYRHCFIVRLNRKGEYVTSAYFQNTYSSAFQTPQYYTECDAVTLTKNNEIIAVGTYYSSSGSIKGLIVKSEYFNGESATSELISHSYAKLWAPGNSNYARDVHTTLDGGIYVTGYTDGWTHSGYDCYVLRLNETLSRVYVKSFGSSRDEYCMSIQVTRNNDYIYVGGHRLLSSGKQELMFFKLDAYADSFVYTRYLQPSTSSEILTMRRIILTQGNAFSGTSDNNELFFCGSTTLNSGDFLFGKLSTTFTVSSAFRYGSPGIDTVGDCALSKDNAYLIGVFSANYYTPRTASIPSTDFTPSSGSSIASSVTTPFTNCNPGNSAATRDTYGVLGLVKCDYEPISNLYNTQDITDAGNSCRDQLVTQLTDFFNDYDTMYTWTDCNYYKFDFDSAECNFDGITFSECDSTYLGVSGYYEKMRGGNTDYFNCNDIFTFWGISQPQPFTNGNDGYKYSVWSRLISTLTPNSKWYPYAFCDIDSSNSNSYSDTFEFVFEQDCTDDALADSTTKTISKDWFIIRIAVSDMNSNTLTNIPEVAAYFGDRTGDEQPRSVQVDEFGYITISGTSNSEVFGAVDDEEYVWLYARTHWQLNWEINVKSGTWSPYTSTYLSKRWVQPKKYKNDGTYTFTRNYLTESSTGTYSDWEKPYGINEVIGTLPSNNTHGNLYQQLSDWKTYYGISSVTLFGKSYYSMNNQLIYRVQKNVPFEFSGPYICTLTSDGKSYSYRKFTINTASISGLTATSNLDASAMATLKGTVTSSEDIYYPDVWAVGFTDDMDINDYSCPADNYWDNQNSDSTVSTLRFQIRLRLKFIVDDVYNKPPAVQKNIPDINILVGQRYTSVDVRNYFQHSCTYYYAQQSLLTSFPKTTMLPYWIQFHEKNGTFTMYPYLVTNGSPYHLEVYCCNEIEECAVNTFEVNVYDTTPTMNSLFVDSYIIQYDKAGVVGEYFTFSMTSIVFSDDDQITGDSANDPYDHQSHTVWLTKTSTNTGFNSIYWIGMIFGKGVGITTNNYGTNTITFKYQDRYSANSVITGQTFTVYVNQIPFLTTIGTSFTFADINPLELTVTSYFDSYFPFLEDDYGYLLEEDISEWFTDPDGNQLTYELTYSDGSDRPGWMGFDQSSGDLRGVPSLSDSSEYMNLKIGAYDTYEGYNYFIKTLLVNSDPVAYPMYKVVILGVGRKYGLDISQFFTDSDGDQLSISVLTTVDETELSNYNLEFSSASKVLGGKPQKIGVIGLVTFQATDTHSYTANFYLTIKIKDLMPNQRKALYDLEDQYLTSGQRYLFEIPNEAFYDPRESTPLVLFATTSYDRKLPDWINFNPMNRMFYGQAPLTDTQFSVRVQIRATNQYSHDSITDEFTIFVVPNNNPKTLVENISEDIEILEGSWFQETLSIGIFTDKEQNYAPKLTIQGASGLPLPNWLLFTAQNRTIYGRAQGKGTFRVDVIFSDDLGLKSYSNFKITVIEKEKLPLKELIFYSLSCAWFLGMVLYIVYLLHFNFMIRTYQKSKLIEKNSKKRFGGFKDVQVDFYEQKSFDGTYIVSRRQAAKTINRKFHYTTFGKVVYEVEEEVDEQ